MSDFLKGKAGSFLATVLYVLLFAIVAVGWYSNQKKLNLLESRYNDWSKLSLILSQLDNNYVDTIDVAGITEKTIPFILKELDPHSVYLPPQEKKVADESLAANFDGIGIEFNVPRDTAVVIHVIPGGPSEKAGLLSGDRIVEVDGVKVAGVKMPQDSIVSKMRGPSGSKVEIAVRREGASSLIRFDITRGKIPVNSIDVAYMMNDTTAYVKLSKFSRSTYLEFLKAMPDLLASGMKRMVFDLRDNSGGYLDQALLLANEFLDKDKMIVYMEGVHRPREEFRADGKGNLKNIRLDVLINENSASSSEIFAGAIQDNDRGTIYGRRSFGKGLVQEPINFSDHSGIRLTVARFYTPTGRSIQKPYSNYDNGYMGDLIERYRSGEMTVADSIKHNDSLRYVTPGGKVVYGRGGIIPDIFVPVDTISGNDFLVNVNRNSMQVLFSIQFADDNRKTLSEVDNMDDLNRLLDSFNLLGEFRKYLTEKGISCTDAEWKKSEHILDVQIRAMVGRYSKLDDLAFYPIISEIDNVICRVLED